MSLSDSKLMQQAKAALGLSGAEIHFDEPMKKHTSFQIGGNADVFVMPHSEKELIASIDTLKEFDIPYIVIGNGTNLVVSDKGVRGAVIQIGKNMADIKVDGTKIYAGAGALLSKISAEAYKNGLSGFEKLGGIPGVIGGAVYMNAGAYGAQISDVLSESSYVENSKIKSYTNADYNGGYRSSVYTNSGKIITSAVFEFRKADKSEIKREIDEYKARRKEKQPLSYPSAGSVFKRPEGYFAGALIEQAGLKGYTIGGAQVSELHAGFIINIGDATCSDIKSLVEHIKKTVFEKSGIMLECEIKFVDEKI